MVTTIKDKIIRRGRGALIWRWHTYSEEIPRENQQCIVYLKNIPEYNSYWGGVIVANWIDGKFITSTKMYNQELENCDKYVVYWLPMSEVD